MALLSYPLYKESTFWCLTPRKWLLNANSSGSSHNNCGSIGLEHPLSKGRHN